jgi:hypothetical protein
MSGAWCAGHCAPPAHHDQDQRRGQTPEPCQRFGCRLWVWSGPRISGWVLGHGSMTIFFIIARKVSIGSRIGFCSLHRQSTPNEFQVHRCLQRRHLLIRNVPRSVTLTNAVAAKAAVPVGVAAPTCIENPSGVIESFEPGSRLTVYENAPAPALLQQSRATPRQRPFTAGGVADWVLLLRQWCVRSRALWAWGRGG